MHGTAGVIQGTMQQHAHGGGASPHPGERTCLSSRVAAVPVHGGSEHGCVHEVSVSVYWSVHENRHSSSRYCFQIAILKLLHQRSGYLPHVSDAFKRSFDARGRKMGRPEDRGAVLAAWRGLVQHASARDGGLVEVLPPVDDEETPEGVRTL